MLAYTTLYAAMVAIGVVVVVTQILLPLWNNNKTWPVFRPSVAAAELRRLDEVEYEADGEIAVHHQKGRIHGKRASIQPLTEQEQPDNG